MSLTLFTAAGCARCNIAKKLLREKDIAFEEHDAVGEGKERFGQFYRAHRHAVVRGKEGIEFPVLADGDAIRQGVAAVIAYLHSGAGVEGFIGRSELAKGWVGGIHVSAGDPAAVTGLAAVLRFLKENGLKLQLETDGRNAAVLEHLLGQGLGGRVVMDLKGPGRLYGAMLGTEIQPEEVGRTMVLAARCPEVRFETTVAPVPREGEDPAGISYLTPEEIAETARWLKEATGSHRQPYVLRIFDPRNHPDERFRSVEKLPPAALFRHRSAARKFQVLTEIETTST
jgi:pyruvate formate lyase activating enzyme